MKLNAQLAELTSETGEAAILRLQDEIKNCKNILKCGVCFDRPKEVCSSSSNACYFLASHFRISGYWTILLKYAPTDFSHLKFGRL